MSKPEERKITPIRILIAVTNALGLGLVLFSIFGDPNEVSPVPLFWGALIQALIYYPTYKWIVNVSSKKDFRAALLLSLTISIFFYMLTIILPPFKAIEEFTINYRFMYLRGGMSSLREAQNEEGNLAFTNYTPPPRARQDIMIIGLTNSTFDKLKEQWPLHWKYYSNVINKFATTPGNSLFFDIFFMDRKPDQWNLMTDSLKKNRNVFLDYPMVGTLENKQNILDLDKRLDILRKFKLRNVDQSDSYGTINFAYAEPPLPEIGFEAKGLGFANVLGSEGGVIRRVPLVTRLKKDGPNSEDEYFPNIDLLLACDYYGIDPVKDVSYKVGQYVKLSNIPQVQIKRFNRFARKLETSDIMKDPNPERSIIIPVNEQGEMEINYVGGVHSFRSIGLEEVYSDWKEEEAKSYESANGKNIFLIAMYYATGRGAAKDTHTSPFGTMSGVEHHAHALNTILNQEFLQYLPPFGEFIIIIGLAIFYGLAQPRVKTPISFVFFFVIVTGYIVLNFYVFDEYDLVLPVQSVITLNVLLVLSILVFRIITEEENVKFIRTSFSKFISKDVVDQLMKNPDGLKLGGSKIEITVFFSDIRGFTTLSEALTPEDLVKLLNEYLSLMTEEILRFKGTIDKYMGDAIMAFWGAPLPLEDHAYLGCVASLSQMEILKKLQASWRERNIPVIDIGIGLNTGPAVVGNMGSNLRMDYTCMGDTVNLGSRLEGSNKMYGTHIIISEYTYEKVKDKVFARELDLVKVKGKTQPVRIYELMALKDEKDFELLKRPLSD
jgi:adenylate cyclase